jgi:hypothetical protein
MIQAIHDHTVSLGASCPGCAPAADGGDDMNDEDESDDLADKIAGLIAERDALRKALDRLPADRKAALRAIPLEKSADRLGGLTHAPETTDPLELTKRALRRPLTLGQIERLANG